MSPRSAQPEKGSTTHLLTPTTDPGWTVVEEGFNLALEHEIESLFTVANGYVGTRGSLAEGSPMSAPATFIAGVYDIDPQRAIPELAVAPDWTQVRIVLDGCELKLTGDEGPAHRRILDMRQGMLWREWRFTDPAGKITQIRGYRLASLADRHVLVHSVQFTPENFSGHLHLEGRIMPPARRPGHVELIPVDSEVNKRRDGAIRLLELYTGTGVRVAFASLQRVRMKADGKWVAPPMRRAYERKDPLHLDMEIGRTYRVDRLVVVYTSRDTDDPVAAAKAHLKRLGEDGVDAVTAAHVREWEARWHLADVTIEGDEAAQRALRFALYHMISSANPEDERVSIGARTLSGAGYKGHVFWDTDIFMLPFYVHTHPESARALLMYRYHTLAAARDKARRFGYRGALYAWESADTGEETTPPYVLTPDGELMRVLSGMEEHHISADVAFAVCQYWRATGDDAFFLEAGAEILFETARLWASRGEFGEDGRYHIRGVIGPDEYHESVDDNAFTNGLAQWNLEQAAAVAELLAQCWPQRWAELAQRLEITDEERAAWTQAARCMYMGFDPQTGLLEQFHGYFGLEDIDLSQYEGRTVPMDVLLGRERTQGSQVVKQADVVMLIYLLWDRFDPAVRAANFRYYEPRTGHGSSLSPAIHALVAARLGDLELAARYFQQAAEIDLGNNMGNAAGGVHAAALGGLWQAAVFGFAGVHVRDDGLTIVPHLPPQWRALRFPLQWRGCQLRFQVEQAAVEVALVAGPRAVEVAVGDRAPISLAPGQTVRWELTARHSWKEVAA